MQLSSKVRMNRLFNNGKCRMWRSITASPTNRIS